MKQAEAKCVQNNGQRLYVHEAIIVLNCNFILPNISYCSTPNNCRPIEDILPDFPSEALRVGRVLQKDGEVCIICMTKVQEHLHCEKSICIHLFTIFA